MASSKQIQKKIINSKQDKVTTLTTGANITAIEATILEIATTKAKAKENNEKSNLQRDRQ